MNKVNITPNILSRGTCDIHKILHSIIFFLLKNFVCICSIDLLQKNYVRIRHQIFIKVKENYITPEWQINFL